MAFVTRCGNFDDNTHRRTYAKALKIINPNLLLLAVDLEKIIKCPKQNVMRNDIITQRREWKDEQKSISVPVY